MACRNGITLKALKSFKGHEWEQCMQGNIYLNGKKIGFWSQDSWGGSDIVELEDGLSRRKFKDKLQELTDSEYCAVEIFMGGLLDLIDAEKQYKKFAKNRENFQMIYLTDGYHVTYIAEDVNEESPEKVVARPSIIKLVKENFFKDAEIECAIYRNASDFYIGDPLNIREFEK